MMIYVSGNGAVAPVIAQHRHLSHGRERKKLRAAGLVAGIHDAGGERRGVFVKRDLHLPAERGERMIEELATWISRSQWSCSAQPVEHLSQLG